MKLSQLEVWFVTGSQHLYGEKALAQVAAHSQQITAFLSAGQSLPFEVVFKPVRPRPRKFAAFAGKRIALPNASDSFFGCIPSLPPKCGSAA